MSSSMPDAKLNSTQGLAYVKKLDLTGIHQKRITGVAISPDGRYIATCSEDCSVTLWLVSTGELTHRITARSAVLCATWPRDPEALICGTADGTLLSITITSPHLIVSGIGAHTKPIEHLVVNEPPRPSPSSPRQRDLGLLPGGRRLASAGHDEIKVWELYGEEWMPEQIIQHPPPTSQSDEKPFLVTALQWLPPVDEGYDDLVVAYLYHGIYRLEGTHAQQVKWSIHLSLCGPCSVSPSDSILAANIILGFEVYAFPAGTRTWRPPVIPSQTNKALPLRFIHGGDYLLFGCHDGKVRMHSSTGEHIDTLRHDGWGLIQALDAVHDVTSGTFLIACGSGESATPDVRIWKAEMVE